MTDSPIGSVIGGRYRVDSLIGTGGMADVYRGVDLTLDRPVAVKVLTDRSGDIRQRFLREARSMARLNHPNIVSVYDAGESDGLSYIVMELAAGRTLRALSDDGLALERAVALCIDLCEALEYAHAQGVIHRDIKPSNVMVLESGVVKIMDFGLARRTTDVSMTAHAGEIVGTISYLPPERFLGRAGDVAGDLYSLGVVMYELFCRHLPFESGNDDLVAVIFAHINQQPPPPRSINPDLPPALEALILRMLAKDAGHRPSSARDVAAVLRAILAGTAETPAPTAEETAAESPLAAQVPATEPARESLADESTRSVRSLLDATLRSSRTLTSALAEVMAGMLATRNRRYEEAETSYTNALATLDGLPGQELEWAKTALKYAMMTLQRATEGRTSAAEVTRAEDLLERAIPVLHARQLRAELTDAERIVQAFRRLSDRIV